MAVQPHYHGGQVPLLPFPLQTSPAFPLLPPLSTLSKNNPVEALDLAEPLFISVPQSTTGLGDQTHSLVDDSDNDSEELERDEKTSIQTDLIDPWTPSAVSLQDSMKGVKTKATIGVLSTLIAYVSLNSLYRALNPNALFWVDEDREESSWVATSHSWFDRKACRWLGLCGAAHLRTVRGRFGHPRKQVVQQPIRGDEDWQSAWHDGKSRLEDWSNDERVLREIPDYVLEYAPLVHLYSEEQFWPCDIAEHLYHITPELNYTPVQSSSQHPKLTDLNGLNKWDRGRYVFLTSNDNVEELPDWLEGEKNIPSPPTGDDDDSIEEEAWAEWDGRIVGELPDDIADGRDSWYDVGRGSTRGRGGDRLSSTEDHELTPTTTEEGEDFIDETVDEDVLDEDYMTDLRRRTSNKKPTKRLRGGRSDAPAVLVVVNKGNGIVDAFWFFFYSFNLGNVVLNIRFGNHVGDWEHTLVRFQHGKPKAVFFSEHSFGDAYSYEAVEKIGKRVCHSS